MDAFHTIVLVLAGVVYVSGDCPYENPAQRGMECIKDLPPIDFGRGMGRPPASSGDTSGSGSHSGHMRRKRDTANHTAVDVMPPTDGTSPVFRPPPDLSMEFLEFFCSDAGAIMIDCATDLVEKCGDHPDISITSFNPKQAKKAHDMCKEKFADWKLKMPCINATMRSPEVQTCIQSAYMKYYVDKEGASPEAVHCSTTAEMYNCYIRIAGRSCGEQLVAFIIGTARAMESPLCTPIINRLYQEPVSAAPLPHLSLIALLNALFVLVLLQ